MVLNLLILLIEDELKNNKSERKILLTIDTDINLFMIMADFKRIKNTFYFVCKYKRSWEKGYMSWKISKK